MYAIIPKHISHETIDQETIVINLEKGHYYSLEHTASAIWIHITDGKEIASLIAGYTALNPNACDEIEHFLKHLEEEELISLHGTLDIASENIVAESYATPLLQKFTDMEDLLLLDPIHDTSESGWPHRVG